MTRDVTYSERGLIQGELRAQRGGKVIRFAWPPYKGAHPDCYRTFKGSTTLAPAEGLDLAVLTHGAHNQDTPLWKKAELKFSYRSYVRTPHRCLLIPSGNIKGDPCLSGILVERDVEGNGLNTIMNVPDLSSWRQNDDGVYVQHDNSYSAVFVPSTSYEGRSFEKDGVAHAHLTPEGAELFARTARDAGLDPYNWLAHRVNKIKSPEQRVSLLSKLKDMLYLGGHFLDDEEEGYTFARFIE